MRYMGLRIGVILRNSTKSQVGNYRAQIVETDATARIAQEGGTAVVYDEQGTSGRNLALRAVAKRLLDDVASGVIHGVYAHDLSRLTRDEWGADAGRIASILARHHALLVTAEREYRLWVKGDLLLYRIQTAIAGGELLDIRDRLTDGLMGRARNEVFFTGTTPWGYTTVVEERGARLVRVPARDLSCADAARDLGDILDTALSLSEAALRMSVCGHEDVRRRGPERGASMPWARTRIRDILRSDLYGGVWRWAGVVHVRDDLAWWDMLRIVRWRERFAARPDDQPWRRTPRATRHLRGLLACWSCGRHLVSAGVNGYICNAFACVHRPSVSDAVAWRMAREAFAWAIDSNSLEDAIGRQLSKPPVDDIARQRHACEEALQRLIADWYSPGAGPVPDAVRSQMSALRDRLGELTVQAGALVDVGPSLRQAARDVAHNPSETLSELPLDVQAEIIKQAISDLRIRSHGKGKALTHSWSATNMLANIGDDPLTRFVRYIAPRLSLRASKCVDDMPSGQVQLTRNRAHALSVRATH
jgi:DNA invertase Pin-like site-specific DNA recombinase